MKLWEKGIDTHQKIDAFTVGNDRELDMHLAKHDVLGNIAHAKMLQSIGIISKEELELLVSELHNISGDIDAGSFNIEDEFEDVHSKIESVLTQKLGSTGKKIHTARSRNDQVLVDMHLYAKEQIDAMKGEVNDLANLFLELADKYKATLIPGYTHLQVAMPSSFGLWFSAYAEVLIDDIHMLNAAYKVADQNPLGSAAGYGSSFPIDREMTTELLNFQNMKVNSIAAQMTRGKLEKNLGFAIASLAGTLSKFAMDVCLYMSQNFGFLSFPDELTTGSSIMPHKKNPDVFELIRGKCNALQSLPNELILIQNNLPSGYHRDLQLLKGSLVPAIQEIRSCMEMTEFMLQNVEVTENILEDQRYDYIFSVDELNKLVQEGVPFRDAYVQIAQSIASGTFEPDRSPNHIHVGSIGNLRLDLIKTKLEKALKE